MGDGLWELGLGFLVKDAGLRVLVYGCWVMDKGARLWVLDYGYWVMGAGLGLGLGLRVLC